jgi:hypothetical protein
MPELRREARGDGNRPEAGEHQPDRADFAGRIDAAKVFSLEELGQMKAPWDAKIEEERQSKAQAKLLPAPGEK